MNNTPFIHLRSWDSRALSEADKKVWLEQTRRSGFASLKKYGWDQAHFYLTFFGETSIIHYDEIINAANRLQFSEIDYLFDEFFDRLQNKKLADCELVYCQSRATCKYV